MNIKSRLQSGYLVSTVDMGDGYYETMVFRSGPKSSPHWNILWCRHTDQQTDAHVNHMNAVQAYSDGKPFTTTEGD